MSQKKIEDEPGLSPFEFEHTLRENIVHSFYREALEWMTGGRSGQIGKTTHPVQTGCWWGAALYLEAFVAALESYQRTQHGKLDRGSSPLKTVEEARSLHDRALTIAIELCANVTYEKVTDNQQDKNLRRASWEGVVYDTALIARALLIFLRFEESSLGSALAFPADRSKDLAGLKSKLDKEGLLRSVLEWLFDRVDEWDLVQYHAGPQDWGMLLRLLAIVKIDGRFGFITQKKLANKLVFKNRSRAVVGEGLEWNDPVSFHAYVADRLLVEANHTAPTLTSNTEFSDVSPPNMVDWGGTLSTAHVILGLAEILPNLKDEGREERISDRKGHVAQTLPLYDRVIETLTEAVITLEYRQKNGNWGVPNETAIALQAYVTACISLSKAESTHTLTTVEPLEDVTFRAVRWLVDANQRFSDGSILHLSTYTAFFSLSLATLLDQSESALLDRKVSVIYDRVLWSIIGGSLEERRRRLILNSRLISLQETGLRLIKRVETVLWLFTAAAFMLVIYVVFRLGLFYLPPQTQDGDPTLNWIILSIILAAGTTIFTIMRSFIASYFDRFSKKFHRNIRS